MKRKLLALLLVVLCAVMCLCLASCGDDEESTATTKAEQNGGTDGSKPHTHAYGEWEETKSPTCTENGEKEQACSCGDKKTETVNAKGHSYKSEKCSDCENVIQKSEGLQFTLNADNASYSVSGIGSCTSAEISIPSTYEGLPVTGIADGAFEIVQLQL